MLHVYFLPSKSACFVEPFRNFRSFGFTGAVTCCFNLLLHWIGTGWFEIPTEWKPCKRVRARGGGAWACLNKKIRGHQPVWGLKRYYPHIRYEYYWIVTRSTSTRSSHCDVNSDAPVAKKIYYMYNNKLSFYFIQYRQYISTYVCMCQRDNCVEMWLPGAHRKLTFIHQ